MTTKEQKRAAWEHLKEAVERGVEIPNLRPPHPPYWPDPNDHRAVALANLFDSRISPLPKKIITEGTPS